MKYSLQTMRKILVQRNTFIKIMYKFAWVWS